MDLLSLDGLIKLVSGFGLPGAILVIWFLSDRNHSKTLAAYREDTLKMHQSGRESLAAVKQMYENNAVLVKAYQNISGGFQDLVVESTKTLTKVCDAIDRNQYCPMVRLKKDAKGPQGD
jgi:hypothetical protein